MITVSPPHPHQVAGVDDVDFTNNGFDLNQSTVDILYVNPSKAFGSANHDISIRIANDLSKMVNNLPQ